MNSADYGSQILKDIVQKTLVHDIYLVSINIIKEFIGFQEWEWIEWASKNHLFYSIDQDHNCFRFSRSPAKAYDHKKYPSLKNLSPDRLSINPNHSTKSHEH